VGWRGPAEVELKHDPRDGTHKVLEINPRLPGNLRHASLCGVEPAVAAVRATLGESCVATPGLPAYRDGIAYLAPTLFLKSVLHDIRARGCLPALARACREITTAGQMLRSLAADPLPNLTRMLVQHRACRPATFAPGTADVAAQACKRG
jgi:hypothetical protein